MSRTVSAWISSFTRCCLATAIFQSSNSFNTVVRRPVLQHPSELPQWNHAKITAFPRTHGNRLVSDLPLTYHQEIRDSPQGMVANFITDLLISQVSFRPDTLLRKRFFDFAGVPCMLIGNIHNDHLDRCQPHRQTTLGIL